MIRNLCASSIVRAFASKRQYVRTVGRLHGLSFGQRGLAVSTRLQFCFGNAGSPARIDPDVQERIMELGRKFLTKVKDAKVDSLTPTASFEELGMDSLDTVDFIVALEESFGLDISNEDAENRIRSIKDACEVFTEYVQKKSEAASQGQGASSAGKPSS